MRLSLDVATATAAEAAAATPELARYDLCAPLCLLLVEAARIVLTVGFLPAGAGRVG